MTSLTKPEVHNASQRRQSIIDQWPHARVENFECFWDMLADLDKSIRCCRFVAIGVARTFWLGGPVNFHHWLRLPWTTLVTVRLGLPTIGTENTGRIKPSTERARCGAPKARRSRRRRCRGGGVGSWEGLCPSPENFSNFCLEIACYSASWKQFFRLDSSHFSDQIVTLGKHSVKWANALDPYT